MKYLWELWDKESEPPKTAIEEMLTPVIKIPSQHSNGRDDNELTTMHRSAEDPDVADSLVHPMLIVLTVNQYSKHL